MTLMHLFSKYLCYSWGTISTIKEREIQAKLPKNISAKRVEDSPFGDRITWLVISGTRWHEFGSGWYLWFGETKGVLKGFHVEETA